GIIKELRNGGMTTADVKGFQSFQGFAATLTADEAAAVAASDDVRWIEPVIERHATAQARATTGQTIPYGVDLVHARDAWAARRTGSVNVAVLDTGIDYRHDELKAIYAGGFNTFDPKATPFDDGAHGTHVAGTIAAADNDSGVVGVAPYVRLWGVKVLNSAGSGNSETVVAGIDWVVKKKKEVGGNWIINLSLGSPNASSAERESVQRATDAGILIAAASGNESSAQRKVPVIYPAAYPNVIAVGAIDEAERIADFSNQGPELDLVAPGVAVLSTIPKGLNFITSVAGRNRAYFADALDKSPGGGVTGEFVFCDLGHPGQFPPSVRGRIAVIRRGELTFAVKSRNAVDAGAIGVVIINNTAAPGISWTLQSETDPWSFTYDWPIVVVGMTQADGATLLTETGQITVSNDPDDYAFFNGTSMSSPHVAGAAALLWTLAPQAKASDIVNALTSTAVDRGTKGTDPVYGAGVLNIYAAAQLLAPGAFTSGGPTTGRPIGKRGRG
ncbi:MAG TPA: S8 family serine peptidase, partial [Thermoanaerobaculia bacterium]|nr:S8 family serine peptidase [Thermoanaerobaculia bacterium]